MKNYKNQWISLTLLVIGCALQCAFIEKTHARSFRVGMLPNGNALGCASCHIRNSGGGPRTPFGDEVRSIVGGSRAPFWSEVLASMDSDGDGFSNGIELGDPDGDGIAEAGAQVTNPGDTDSFPDISTPEPVSTTLFIQANGKELTLTWEEGGTLESSRSPLGPYFTVENATSPYQTSADGPTMFYRVGDGSGGQTFTVFLRGGQEVPAVTTEAHGSGSVSLDGNFLTVNVIYEGLQSDFTAAHIHGPAAKGTNSGVLIALSGTDLHQSETSRSGTFMGGMEVTDAAAQAIISGEAYINIHTTGNGGGEIRGQITP